MPKIAQILDKSLEPVVIVVAPFPTKLFPSP